MSKFTRLGRRRAFTCLHLYRNDEWSDEQNRATFGACFTPHGHGHNYELEVFFSGPVDSATGMILNLIDIDHLLGEALAPIQGKHLNFEVKAFRDQAPTGENLARFLCDDLVKRLAHISKDVTLAKLRLFESRDLWVDVWPA